EDPSSSISEVSRFVGVSLGAASVVSAMLAGYGITGLLERRKLWRLLLFCALMVVSLLGGFRFLLIQIALTCCILFYLEGLARTRMMPAMVIVALFVGTATIAFVDRLPLNIQRTFSFLPVNVSATARADAAASSEWRV